MLKLVAVAGSDRGVAADAVAVSIESLRLSFTWRDRLKMAVSCHVSVVVSTPNSNVPFPFTLSLFSILRRHCPRCPRSRASLPLPVSGPPS